MSKEHMMDIHGCIASAIQHFYDADYLRLEYTLPVKAYQLNRTLLYNLCQAWKRFEQNGLPLSQRESQLLAESWLLSAPSHTKILFINAAWNPDCLRCGDNKIWHRSPSLESFTLLCKDGQEYDPELFKAPMGGWKTHSGKQPGVR